MCSFASETVLYHIKFQIPQYNLDNIFSGYFFLWLLQPSALCSVHSIFFLPFPPPYPFPLLQCGSSPWATALFRTYPTGNKPAAPSLRKPCHTNPTQCMILLLMFLFLKIMCHSSRKERFDIMSFLFSNAYYSFVQQKNCGSGCKWPVAVVHHLCNNSAVVQICLGRVMALGLSQQQLCELVPNLHWIFFFFHIK